MIPVLALSKRIWEQLRKESEGSIVLGKKAGTHSPLGAEGSVLVSEPLPLGSSLFQKTVHAIMTTLCSSTGE